MQRGEIIIFHWKNCHTRSWSRHHLVHYRIFFDNLLAVKWWNKTTVLRLNHQLPCVRCLRNGFSRYQLIMIKFIKWQISVESWHQRFFMQKSLHCNIQNRQSILCNLTGKLEHLRLLTSQTYLGLANLSLPRQCTDALLPLKLIIVISFMQPSVSLQCAAQKINRDIKKPDKCFYLFLEYKASENPRAPTSTCVMQLCKIERNLLALAAKSLFFSLFYYHMQFILYFASY